MCRSLSYAFLCQIRSWSNMTFAISYRWIAVLSLNGMGIIFPKAAEQASVSLSIDCYLSSRCKVQKKDCHVLCFVFLLDSTKKHRLLATTNFPENTTSRSTNPKMSPKWYCTCCCAALRMIDGAFTVCKEFRPLLVTWVKFK